MPRDGITSASPRPGDLVQDVDYGSCLPKNITTGDDTSTTTGNSLYGRDYICMSLLRVTKRRDKRLEAEKETIRIESSSPGPGDLVQDIDYTNLSGNNEHPKGSKRDVNQSASTSVPQPGDLAQDICDICTICNHSVTDNNFIRILDCSSYLAKRGVMRDAETIRYGKEDNGEMIRDTVRGTRHGDLARDIGFICVHCNEAFYEDMKNADALGRDCKKCNNSSMQRQPRTNRSKNIETVDPTLRIHPKSRRKTYPRSADLRRKGIKRNNNSKQKLLNPRKTKRIATSEITPRKRAKTRNKNFHNSKLISFVRHVPTRPAATATTNECVTSHETVTGPVPRRAGVNGRRERRLRRGTPKELSYRNESHGSFQIVRMPEITDGRSEEELNREHYESLGALLTSDLTKMTVGQILLGGGGAAIGF